MGAKDPLILLQALVGRDIVASCVQSVGKRSAWLDWRDGRKSIATVLRQLHFDDSVEIGAGPDGRPLFPDEISGSLTHCWPYHLAAAGPSEIVPAIGIDVEYLDRMSPNAAMRFLSTSERNAATYMHLRTNASLLMLSCKEAGFKASRQPSSSFLNVRIELGDSTFVWRTDGSSGTGTWSADDHFIASFARSDT